MDQTSISKLFFVCHYITQINSRGIWFGDDPLSYSVPSLLLQLSLITLLTRLIHYFLKPFGQPLIVSQILGGVIVGPSVLGRNSTFSDKVFPVTSRMVLDTLSIFGFMLFIFVIGIKVDPTIVFRSGKKALFIGILGFFVPYGLSSLVAYLLQRFLLLDNSISSVLPQIALLQSMTTFPVITCFLDDLKILNSEIGRLATSSSFISDVCHWSVMSIKVVAKLAETKSVRITMGSFLSCLLFIIFILFGIRPAALWAIRQTPEGKPVNEIYIFAILVALMCCGFIGEAIGLSSILASLALGLVIPDGPPLGAALVERLDCFVSVMLMPLFFAVCGLNMNVFSIQNFGNAGVLQFLIMVAFIGKIVATILPPLFCRMPFRDAFAFALIMNSKGIVELGFLSDFRQINVMSEEIYAIMVMSVVVITGVISPIVKIMYDPSKRFLAYKRRTILHLRPKEELHMLACLHNQDHVRAIISLLQLSHPTIESPISLVVLHLIKLTGRASSQLIPYVERETRPQVPSQSERIFSVFHKFEQLNSEFLMVQCYKGVSPYATMHNDACSLALERRTILVIVPFHKQWTFGNGVESHYSYRHLNKNVLEKAPCSVGVLIDRGSEKLARYVIPEPSLQRVVVLFLGGADDREALAYGQRMSENPNVTLHLIRFTSSNASEIVGGKDRSKMLDGAILSNFKKNFLRKERVSYQEEEVSNGSGVIAVIKSIINDFDLVMVGRRHGESKVLSHLKKWNERGELGHVGEILASSDIVGGGLVLVVQQQTKLWGLQDPEESTHLRKLSL